MMCTTQFYCFFFFFFSISWWTTTLAATNDPYYLSFSGEDFSPWDPSHLKLLNNGSQLQLVLDQNSGALLFMLINAYFLNLLFSPLPLKYCIALHCIVLYCIVLYCIVLLVLLVLYCIVWNFSIYRSNNT